MASPLINNNSNLIISLATRHRLPGIYPFRTFVANGGLICYGPDPIDPHRRAAGYVDRILKGEKPAELPVQAATKFELVINLKTAKALGLTVPPSPFSCQRGDRIRALNVRYWHKADMPLMPMNALFGVTRTSPAHWSNFSRRIFALARAQFAVTI